MVEVLVSDVARNNLKEIKKFIANDSPLNAERVIKKITTTFHQLKKYPEIGKPVAVFKNGFVRRLLCYRYIIFYVFENNVVTIVAIHHSSRNINIEADILSKD